MMDNLTNVQHFYGCQPNLLIFRGFSQRKEMNIVANQLVPQKIDLNL